MRGLRKAGEVAGTVRDNSDSILERLRNAPSTLQDAATGVVEGVQDRFSPPPIPFEEGPFPRTLEMPGRGFEEFAPLKTMQNLFNPGIFDGDSRLPLNRDPKGFIGNVVERVGGGFNDVVGSGAGSLNESMGFGGFMPRPSADKVISPRAEIMSLPAKIGLGAAGLAGAANLRLANTANNAETVQQGLSTAQKAGLGAAGVGLAAGGAMGLNRLQTMDD
jgi:hypothetical protein